MSEHSRQRLYCPRCHRQLLERCAWKQHPVAVCPRCAGLWMEPTAWDRKKLGPLPEAGHIEELVPEAAPVRLQVKPSLVCPECHGPLTALQVGGRQGCELDQCARCGGVWLDHAEWDHLEALQTIADQQQELDRPPTWGEWAFQFFLRLPVEFNVEPRRVPLVTLSLIAACALAGLLQMTVGEEAWLPWGLRATEVLSGRGWLTLFTSMFLHASAVHFLVNMYFLYILGDNVEDALGHWPFLFFYLACGLLADGAWLLLNPVSDIPLVGASGAIAGVMAAYLILYRQARLTFMLIFWQFKVPAWIWLGAWFGLQLVGLLVDSEATEGGVAFLGHVGGFLAGALLIWPFEEAILRRNPLLRLLRDRETQT